MITRLVLCFLWIFCAALATTPSITIREFNSSTDTGKVVQLIKTEWKKLFLLPSYDESLVQRMLVNRKPGDTSAHDAKLLVKVLEIEGVFAGFITFFLRNPTIGQIELLAIDQSHRSKGLGRLLIDHARDYFKIHGRSYMQLYVYTSNPKAISFYERLNFTVKAHFGHYQLLGKSI